MADLLPDPPPQEVRYTVISVDDHLVEPPDMFEGRLPAALADRAPKVIETSKGHEVWLFDDQVFTQVGLNAVAGRDPESWALEPCRFDEMRPGCFDLEARIHDQDLAGIWASMSFPSQISGFCGTVFSGASDPGLGLAVTQAWNDWVYEAWWQPHPDRTIPLGITWLADPELGAAEVRRNAERGFRAVTLPEQPHKIGYPSVHSGYWDPILEACEETETVVCLHVGSSGMMDMPLDGPLVELGATLFGALSLHACADWLWSGRPVRFPDLKIAMSEGGIGWVPLLIDRLDYVMHHSGHGTRGWMSDELLPSEVLRRSFWFCTIDDPSSLSALDVIGAENVMVEVDYPHADSLWPGVQDHLVDRLGHLPVDDVRKLTHQNAAALFRHPLPPVPLP
jgi:predicted TIM-barrel fold metal-dependent hydrolase